MYYKFTRFGGLVVFLCYTTDSLFKGVYMKRWMFPAGERGVNIGDKPSTTLYLDFKGSDSIIDMLLEVDALKRIYGSNVPLELVVPYFPYARQDRVMKKGESHSLSVIAKLINSQGFAHVTTYDPHSDVVEALIDNLTIIPQDELFLQTVFIPKYDYLIAPDAGALKKIYKLSKKIQIPVICAYKQRDLLTGDVTSICLSKEDYSKLEEKTAIIVDDICDGGRTFIELCKVLPTSCTKDLYTTHGIYSSGKDELNKVFRSVFCYNNMSKSQ